jgi:hypothetical protein
MEEYVMKRSKGHPLALLVLLAISVAGGVLRGLQLDRVFDQDGLPETGHPLTWALAIGCVIAVLGIGLFCLRLPRRKTWKAVYRSSVPDLVLSVAAGFLLILASLLHIAQELLDLSTSSQQLAMALKIVVDAVGIVSGLCILAAVGVRQKGGTPKSLTYILPFLFVLFRLVLDFRTWSSDPIILDYCFKLFALLCTMGGAYRIGGFCFDQGRRRLTAFWSMTGVFFCVVAMPGGGMVDLCYFTALGLWMLSCTQLALSAGSESGRKAKTEEAKTEEA